MKKQGNVSYILSLSSGHRGKMICGMVLAVIDAMLAFVPYYAIYRIILGLFTGGETKSILFYVLFTVASAVIKTVCSRTSGLGCPFFGDVSGGRITIGGRDIRELNPSCLLQYIGEVFQESILLSDTIYNNIRIGRPDASKTEIYEAAKAAQCHDFIT